MASRLVLRNAIASAGQVALSAGSVFLLYRVLLQHLTIPEIGLWALIVGSVAVARLSEFGLGTGLVRYVAHDLGAGNSAMAARTITMGALGVFCFIGLASIVAYPIALHFILEGIPKSSQLAARQLLPLALGALVLASVSNAFVSALDGQQKMTTRAAIQLSGNVFQLVAAIILVPSFGLISLGWIQITQAGLTLIANAVATYMHMGLPIRHYRGWDRARFRELLTYGGSIQLAAIGQMLFEPVAKIMLTSFSGLTLVGYFEMGNRVTQQFRTILVSGYNAMVPYVAAQVGAGHSREKTSEAYIVASRLLLAVAFPYFAGVAAMLPLVLIVWSNTVEPTFLAVALIMWVGWSLNTLAGPAYFTSLAVGQLRWVIMSQASVGCLNVIFGLIGNWLGGGLGILCGTAVALAIGSLAMPLAFMIHNGISMRSIFQGRTLPGIVLWAASGYLAWKIGISQARLLALLAPALTGFVVVAVILSHPLVREMLSLVFVRREARKRS